jgi:hypothetical protein
MIFSSLPAIQAALQPLTDQRNQTVRHLMSERVPDNLPVHQTARRAPSSKAAKTLDGGAGISRDAWKVIAFALLSV